MSKEIHPKAQGTTPAEAVDADVIDISLVADAGYDPEEAKIVWAKLVKEWYDNPRALPPAAAELVKEAASHRREFLPVMPALFFKWLLERKALKADSREEVTKIKEALTRDIAIAVANQDKDSVNSFIEFFSLKDRPRIVDEILNNNSESEPPTLQFLQQLFPKEWSEKIKEFLESAAADGKIDVVKNLIERCPEENRQKLVGHAFNAAAAQGQFDMLSYFVGATSKENLREIIQNLSELQNHDDEEFRVSLSDETKVFLNSILPPDIAEGAFPIQSDESEADRSDEEAGSEEVGEVEEESEEDKVLGSRKRRRGSDDGVSPSTAAKEAKAARTADIARVDSQSV